MFKCYNDIMKIHIDGDGSYLGLINFEKYKTFVSSNWADTPKLLEPHFIEHMKNHSAIFWDTNLDSDWVIDFRINENSKVSNYFRKFNSSIQVTTGSLYLLEYDDISKLAGDKDLTLEDCFNEQEIWLENGIYKVEILQLNNPRQVFSDGDSIDFIINANKTDEFKYTLDEVPWSLLS